MLTAAPQDGSFSRVVPLGTCRKKMFWLFDKNLYCLEDFSLNVANGGNTKLINLEELYIGPVLLMDSQYHFL